MPETTPLIFGVRKLSRIEFDPAPEVTVNDSRVELPSVRVFDCATACTL